jgi:hypothetical protein
VAEDRQRRRPTRLASPSSRSCLGEAGSLSQGVQEGRQALRMLNIHGVEVHGKRPRGVK